VTSYRLEVITLPVDDVDRALDFYGRQLGFPVDVDYHPSDRYRVVQLTPPGSACSIQFGVGLTDAVPGRTLATYLVVDDIQTTRRELRDRGVRIGPIQHKSPIDDWQGNLQDGIDPQRRDYASLATFTDPDGNHWILQEVGHRATSTAATTEITAPGHDDT
jgi:catechol 2,3-dioxygenase-like lactoylglutathione lyase family enzyme